MTSNFQVRCIFTRRFI